MSMIAKIMDRKRWIVGGIILTGLVVGVFFILLNLFSSQADPRSKEGKTVVSELAYCNGDQAKPCIVSFGLDADGNMLVNILLPDLSFPDFYLKIIRNDTEVVYECQRIVSALNNAYCLGEKLPPGEFLQLLLISSKEDVVLAQGSLSILGLAFPTLEIVISTEAPAVTVAPTESFDFILSTPTQFGIPSPTSTPLAYPNPSYP